jgi:hypothetical protein
MAAPVRRSVGPYLPNVRDNSLALSENAHYEHETGVLQMGSTDGIVERVLGECKPTRA